MGSTQVIAADDVLMTELIGERLALANELFQQYHARCFWHCSRDLVISEELIPLVANGLRKHGGRREKTRTRSNADSRITPIRSSQSLRQVQGKL